MEPQCNFQLELGGRKYKTTRIGNLLWMAENLSLLVKESWFYDDNAIHGEKYGRLYTWKAAMDACPEGWRLPSKTDWEQMVEHLGGHITAFNNLTPGGTSGFNALFAGYRNLDGLFLSLGRAADFWTSTEAGKANAHLFYMIHKKETVFNIIDDKRCGFSVRYVKSF